MWIYETHINDKPFQLNNRSHRKTVRVRDLICFCCESIKSPTRRYEKGTLHSVQNARHPTRHLLCRPQPPSPRQCHRRRPRPRPPSPLPLPSRSLRRRVSRRRRRPPLSGSPRQGASAARGSSTRRSSLPIRGLPFLQQSQRLNLTATNLTVELYHVRLIVTLRNFR